MGSPFAAEGAVVLLVSEGAVAAEAGGGLAAAHPLATQHTIILLVAEGAVAAEVGRSLVVAHPLAAAAAVVFLVPEGAVVAQHGPNARHHKELVIFRGLFRQFVYSQTSSLYISGKGKDQQAKKIKARLRQRLLRRPTVPPFQSDIIFPKPSIQMSTHDELLEEIRKQIADFEAKLGALKGLKGGAREQAVGRHEKHLKRIRRLMDTYQYLIQSGSFEGRAESHKSQFKEFEVVLARLEKGLATSRNDLGEEDDLFKHRNKSNKNIDVNSRQAVIAMGHEAQKESEDALKRVQKNLIQMDEQADLIITEMDRQIKKLDEVYDELCDTETTLKRAEKHLKYFAKQIYTDRLMICMIIVIALAILVIIALAIAGKTPKAMKNTV